MSRSRQSLYLVGSLLLLLMILVIGYLWYQNRTLSTNSILPITTQDTAQNPVTGRIARPQNGPIADTPLLGVLEIGVSRIPTITGVVESIDLIDMDTDSFPAQYYVLLKHLDFPQARFRVNIGHPEYMMLVRYPVDRSGAGNKAEENLKVSELVKKLSKDDVITVDLVFPEDQPEIRSEFMESIESYDKSLKEGETNPFNVHLFRVQKLALPKP